jgi:hypothetical protein
VIHSFLAQLQDSFERLPAVSAWRSGRRMLHDHHHRLGAHLGAEQIARRPLRTDVINFLLSTFTRPTAYLEIGVRNPHDNFAHVRADAKWGVDPGIEFRSNPVAYPMTSDAFFEAFAAGRCGELPARFDVIFLDGLHYAEQLDRDIAHSLDALADDGFIVLHDCNPPTEWHARECFAYGLSPASTAWNGTAWKAFLKYRYRRDLQSCCIDTDWGVGVISRTAAIGAAPRVHNPFFEFGVLESNRRDLLNLLSFDDFVAAVSGGAEARPDATPATTPSRRQHQASGRAA